MAHAFAQILIAQLGNRLAASIRLFAHCRINTARDLAKQAKCFLAGKKADTLLVRSGNRTLGNVARRLCDAGR